MALAIRAQPSPPARMNLRADPRVIRYRIGIGVSPHGLQPETPVWGSESCTEGLVLIRQRITAGDQHLDRRG